MRIQSLELPGGPALPYVESGDPHGVPVLLLHGATDSWRSWEPMLPHLPAEIRAIALTQRGHGDAEKRPRAGYTIQDLGDDAAAVIDALELGPTVVMGHSMGAWAAKRLAIDHPTLISALILEAVLGAPRAVPDLAAFCEHVASLDAIDPEFALEFQASTVARPLSPGAIEGFAAESMKLPDWLWRELFAGFLDADLTSELPDIAAPTLLLWGDQDAFTGHAEQALVLARIPDSRLEVYEGVGHAVHWERPASVAADVAAFALDQSRSRTMSSSESSGLSKRALTA